MSEEIAAQESVTTDKDFFDEIQEKEDQVSVEKPSKEPEPSDEESEEEQEEEVKEKEREKEEPEKEKPEKLSKKYEELLKEKEKLQKNLLETQKYATKKAQQAKISEKKIQSLYERGALSEDEAQVLLAKSDEEDSPFETEEDLPELAHYFKAATKEFENLKRYSDDESLEEKREAFNFIIANSSPESLLEMEKDLEPYKDNPVILAKKMLKVGEENLSLFKEIKSLGGIKEYAKYKDEIISNKDKKIEKLERERVQYKDHDERPNYRLNDYSPRTKEEDNSNEDPFDSVKAKDSRPHQKKIRY